MSGGTKVLIAILSIVIGSGLTYFFNTTYPGVDLLMLAGMWLVVTGACFFALMGMTKH